MMPGYLKSSKNLHLKYTTNARCLQRQKTNIITKKHSLAFLSVKQTMLICDTGLDMELQ